MEAQTQEVVRLHLELEKLSRYAGTCNWHHVEHKIDVLLEKLWLLRQDANQAEWDC